jgi:hypothetical protein
VRISCVDICRQNFPLSAKGRGDADQREVSVGKALLSGAVKWATYMASMAYQKMQNAVLTTSRVFENPTDSCARSDFQEPRVSQSINRRRNQTMTSFKILSAAAILSMMTAPPLFAQAAIGEPGAYAFYHPNADVLNAGRPLPRETAGAMASVPFRGSNAFAGTDSGANASCAQRYRSYDPGSGTFLGRDGHRHPCE